MLAASNVSVLAGGFSFVMKSQLELEILKMGIADHPWIELTGDVQSWQREIEVLFINCLWTQIKHGNWSVRPRWNLL